MVKCNIMERVERLGTGEIMNRKTGVIFLLMVIILGTSTISGFGNVEFNDLDKKHWSHPNVKTLVKKKIISGYPDGSFQPDQKVTYGEFIKMSIASLTTIESSKTGGHWAEPYYNLALENLWFTTWDIDKTVLDRPIPRAHMALIAYGAMKNTYEKVLGQEWMLPVDYSEIMESIKDVDAGTPYEYAIVSAYGQGVLKGYPNKTFRPEGTLTRAECAAVIGRLMDSCNKMTKNIGFPEDLAKETQDTNMPKSLIETLIDLYQDELWVVYDDDPNQKGPYYVGFKAGDTYRTEADGTISIIYNYPYSYNDRFSRLYGLGVLMSPDTDKEKEHIYAALSYISPGGGQDIYNTFEKAAGKNYQKNEHYMRKEYFGNRPVMIDVGSGMVNICIWTEGSEKNSRTWDVKPGKVKEEYYYVE